MNPQSCISPLAIETPQRMTGRTGRPQLSRAQDRYCLVCFNHGFTTRCVEYLPGPIPFCFASDSLLSDAVELISDILVRSDYETAFRVRRTCKIFAEASRKAENESWDRFVLSWGGNKVLNGSELKDKPRGEIYTALKGTRADLNLSSLLETVITSSHYQYVIFFLC
jgi:hypothetical protein